jgi:hypothetical protein
LFDIAKGSSLRHSHHCVLVLNHQGPENKFELLVVQRFLVGNLFESELRFTHRGGVSATETFVDSSIARLLRLFNAMSIQNQIR